MNWASVDYGRLAEAVSRPGIDPRVWTANARVDQGLSVRWDTSVGWVVDVSPYTGAIDQADIPCRVLSLVSGDGAGEYYPPLPDQEVTISIIDGDINSTPVILGYLNNGDGNAPPSSVAGVPIIGELPASVPSPLGGFVSVSPFDTEIKVSQHNRRVQYSGAYTVQAASFSVIGPVSLGTEGAQNQALIGEKFLNTFIGFVDDLLSALNQPVPPGSIPPGLPALLVQWEILKLSLPLTELSQTVKYD